MFFEKFWSFEGSRGFKISKNFHPKPIILMGLLQKLQKYVQKYAQICGILSSTYYILPPENCNP
jgi:hypothetical protein